jgi:hypothetical protein
MAAQGMRMRSARGLRVDKLDRAARPDPSGQLSRPTPASPQAPDRVTLVLLCESM